jgi:hypothetical protein
MASTGFTICGTGANNTDIGTEAWVNPGNITADDGSNANGNAAAKNEQMNYLVGSNFGFAIPDGATIDGIEARIQAFDSSGGATVDITHVIIYKDDSTPGSDLEAGATSLTGLVTNYDYGSSSELWGLTWTAAEINSADFQLRISTNAGNPAGDAQVDFLAVNILYTEAGGGSVQKVVPSFVESRFVKSPLVRIGC